MSLEDVFPEDPWLPSLRYAASSLIPFNIPWGTKKVEIGTGFHSSRAATDNPFAAECPFNPDDLLSASLRYRNDASGTYTHLESSFGSHSLDHMDFSLGASAAVTTVNSSAQARFEQNAASNSDGIRSSLTGKLFAGYVEFEEPPDFSQTARDVLRAGRNSSGEDLFEKRFGDYYVAALRVGAGNGTELSAGSSSQLSSEASSYSVTVKVEVFCWSASTTYSDSSFAANTLSSATIKFNGYDTLSLVQTDEIGEDITAHQRIISQANTNLEKGKLLQGRLKEKTHRLELTGGCKVTHDQAKSLFDCGLVMELQLLPYAKLREYISSRCRG